MSSSGDKVDVLVLIHMDWMNVRCTGLVRGQYVFRPTARSIGRLFPPGKPLATGKSVASLGGTTNVRTAVLVDVSYPGVMRTSRCVAIGKNMPNPALGGVRVLWNFQPGQRIRKVGFSCGPT